jgi:hypothetical protein
MTIQLGKYTDRLKYADSLIRRKATGNPKHFAQKLGISESHLYNMLDDLRLLGMPLAYDRYAMSYHYTQPVRLRIDIVVEPLLQSEYENVNGGVYFILILHYSNFIRVSTTTFAIQ